MATVKVSWVLPTTRESGRPLNPADLAEVSVEISADQGANWAEIGPFAATETETLQSELEPGEWWFRGSVVDSVGRASKPVTNSIVLADNTPPAALVLTLAEV